MLVPRLLASVAAGGLVVFGMAGAVPALATTHGTAKSSSIHQTNVAHTQASPHKQANVKVATATGKSILIYGPSLNGSPNNEETLAQAAGYSVTVATASLWDSMTTAQFSSYNAIVFGDPTCGGDPSILNPALSNQSTWASAVTGPTVVIGTDPVFHQSQSGVQADQLITNGINFAASASGTGLYADLSCYYGGSSPNTPVPLLSHFGTFTVQSPPVGCDNIDIVDASSPVVAGISNAGLANWGCSVHEVFDSYPSSFSPVVVETDSSPSPAYIIATAPDTVTVNNPGSQSTYQNANLSLQVTGSSSGGHPLSWAASGLPNSLTINSTTGLISGQVKGAPGTYAVTVTATDATGGSGFASFTWTVKSDVGSPVKNSASAKCLNDSNGLVSPGNPIVIWTCITNGPNEKWSHPTNPGELVVYGQCLTDPGPGGSGTKQVIEPCTGASNQIWTHNSKNEYIVQFNGGCLTDPGGSKLNGTQVTVNTCKNVSNQHWQGS